MHPHLDRLNSFNLEVRYRASDDPQDLTIHIAAVPKGTWTTDYPTRVDRLVAMIEHGYAGGRLFAPEVGRAALVSGPVPGDEVLTRDLTWTLRIQSVDPAWLAIALHLLADSWSFVDNLGQGDRFEPNPDFYPERVSILGSLTPDDSIFSVGTRETLALLRDPTPAFAPWTSLPFALKESTKRKGTRLRLGVAATSPDIEETLTEALLYLPHVLHAHPDGGWPNPIGEVASTKGHLVVRWDADFVCPARVARGPILNMVRAFHARTCPVSSVELDLPLCSPFRSHRLTR